MPVYFSQYKKKINMLQLNDKTISEWKITYPVFSKTYRNVQFCSLMI